MGRNKKPNKGIIYSTDPDYEFDLDDDQEEVETLPPQQQNLRVSRQRLKGNKIVTLIKGFVGQEEDLKELGKKLKSTCGCGGTVKDEEILLQGDFKEKVGSELTKLNYRFKFSGG